MAEQYENEFYQCKETLVSQVALLEKRLARMKRALAILGEELPKKQPAVDVRPKPPNRGGRPRKAAKATFEPEPETLPYKNTVDFLVDNMSKRPLLNKSDPDAEIPEVDVAKELRMDSAIGRILKFLGKYGDADVSRIASALGLSQLATDVAIKTLFEGLYIKRKGAFGATQEYSLDIDLTAPPQRGAL